MFATNVLDYWPMTEGAVIRFKFVLVFAVVALLCFTHIKRLVGDCRIVKPATAIAIRFFAIRALQMVMTVNHENGERVIAAFGTDNKLPVFLSAVTVCYCYLFSFHANKITLKNNLSTISITLILNDLHAHPAQVPKNEGLRL